MLRGIHDKARKVRCNNAMSREGISQARADNIVG
jgi:hypothetical protein